jgi:hypothetical protein
MEGSFASGSHARRLAKRAYLGLRFRVAFLGAAHRVLEEV